MSRKSFDTNNKNMDHDNDDHDDGDDLKPSDSTISLESHPQDETVSEPDLTTVRDVPATTTADVERSLEQMTSQLSPTAAKAAIHPVGEVLPPPPPSRPSIEIFRSSLDIPRVYEQEKANLDREEQRRISKELRREKKERAQKEKEAKKKKKKKKKEKKERLTHIDIDEHKLSIEELCARYDIEINAAYPDQSHGLTSDQVKGRLEVQGPNVLKPPKQTPVVLKYLLTFTDLFSILLIVAGALSILSVALEKFKNLENLYLAMVLFFITWLNGIITFIQERKSESILKGFQNLSPQVSRVIRDKTLSQINAAGIVEGDLVKIQGGDKVPADIRIIKANGLIKVDNSSLTGESEPQSRVPDMTDTNPLETKNLVFYGTLVLEGEAYGIVVRTGDRTVIGQLAKLAGETKKKTTPLRRELDGFIKKISVLAISLAIIFFIVGVARGNSVILNFIFAIGVIVANVPQGLIATNTILLTLSAKRLARKKILVKQLEAVETLGSTTVIASDKTGTLTQNRMTAVNFWCNNKMYDVHYTEEDKKLVASDATVNALHRCAALCSRTVFESTHEENLRRPVLERTTIGDASESALLKFAESITDVMKMRHENTKVFEIPFNSKNKWQLSIHKVNNGDERIMLIKGAPERIIEKCSYVMLDGNKVPRDEAMTKAFQDAYDALAEKGERVLGFAQCDMPPDQYPPRMDAEYAEEERNYPTMGYTFLGLIGLMDPPKNLVPEAIDTCNKAGIQVIMVTGDHPATAKSIAKQIGIIRGKTVEDIAKERGVPVQEVDMAEADAVVVHGTRIDELIRDEWDAILAKKEIVFARTSPQQKLIIVEKLQEKGHIVAVTGDGVNDSPALKTADLGISMGISGSDVSKEAAALILMDDNFSSIVAGIAEGRLIFENLKKSIAYTLTHILPEILPFILFITIEIPLPMSAFLILCVDLGTELVPAISLVYESPEADIMNRKPRKKSERLVSLRVMSLSYLQLGVIEALGCLYAYFAVFIYFGIYPLELIGISKDYFHTGASGPFTLERTGRVYSVDEQLDILGYAQSAYFLSLVMIQIANLFSCKTRRKSFFQQGIRRNMVLNFSFLWSLGIAVLLIYLPFINKGLGTRGPGTDNGRIGTLIFWTLPLIWMLFIFVYEELRKLMVRLVGPKFVFAW